MLEISNLLTIEMCSYNMKDHVASDVIDRPGVAGAVLQTAS